MKKLMTALAAIAFATTAMAQTSVVTSSHDLSPTGADAIGAAGQAQGQVCVYCHMPHNANNVGAPLWNRTLPAGPFKMYSSANSSTFQLDATDTNTAARSVGPVSLACLSCHDGVTAFNSLNQGPMIDTDRGIAPSTYTFVNSGAVAVTNMTDEVTNGAPPAVNLGIDLTNDHPISFTFDAALYTLKGGASAGGLKDPAATGGEDFGSALVIYRAGAPASGGPNTIAGQMLFTKPGAGVADQVECASCHEPHMQGLNTDPAGNFPFLIKSNQNSNLCLTCHNK